MTDLIAALEFFHFLRPWWLVAIPPALVLWWRIRRAATTRADLPAGIAPHLAAALAVGGARARRLLAIDGVTATIVLVVLAAAGPSWSRVPNPLVAQTAPLAVVVKVTASMLQNDVSPSRLERAKHKILDVLELRAGARTVLIAYAGSAHSVAPLTEDPAVLKPFLEGLEPDVMPVEGQNATAALQLAQSALEAEEISGAILFVLDDLDRADLPGFERHVGEGGARVVFLVLGGEAVGLARLPGTAVVQVTADAADVAEIDRRVASAYRDALARDERQQWTDSGWILAWPALFLVLFWFRRGWTMRWAAVLVAGLVGLPEGSARAEGLADWFLTADQQGRLAFERKDFATAGELFQDPYWKGYALYRAGRYAEVAPVLGGLATAEAAFLQGMAWLRNREYRPAIAAFETALERAPDDMAAARNLEIAQAILAYVETAREQSDTGEESGIGADDVVFDNESGRGAETRITGEEQVKMKTAEQWMRSVDTRTADFLRSRFALEAARRRP